MYIDFHTHVLPGMDDGSKTVQESMLMLETMKNAGVETVVATPHFYPHCESLENFLERRAIAFQLLNDLMTGRPKILQGCEVLLCKGMDQMFGIERLCIEGTNCILIELPFCEWNHEIIATLERLNRMDSLHIIIAHCNRYKRAQRKLLLELGCDLEINMLTLCSRWKRKRLEDVISNEKLVAVGSDLHQSGHRYPKIYPMDKKARRYLDTILSRTEQLIGGNKKYEG